MLHDKGIKEGKKNPHKDYICMYTQTHTHILTKWEDTHDNYFPCLNKLSYGHSWNL